MDCVGCGSGAVTERPDLTARGYRRFRCRDCGKQFNERSQKLAACLAFLRTGDVHMVTRPDRLARSMGDLLEIAERLRVKGGGLQVLDPPMDTATAAGELIFMCSAQSPASSAS